MNHIVVILAAAAAWVSGTAMAQTPATTMTPAARAPTAKVAKPTAAKPAAAVKSTKPQAPRTAKSLDCSKQADSKGLHGKPRKGFMSTCKKA